MIILNLELGEDLERLFYKKVSKEKISYLKYVEELIINDLRNPNFISDRSEELEEIVVDDKKQSQDSTFVNLC